MAESLIFHYRDADNFLVRLNPNAKLCALLSFSIVVSSAEPYLVFLLSIGIVAAAVAVRLPFRTYVKESMFFIVLALIMAFTSFASDHDPVEAAASSLSFLSMVLASMLLTDSTMPDDLSRSLGSALSHIIGRYAYVLSTVLEITLSMIPLIIDSATGIFEARKARGALFLAHPFTSLCQLAASILSDLLDKAEIYIDALYSRGYDASSRRSSLPYNTSDWVLIAASAAAVFLMILKEIL